MGREWQQDLDRFLRFPGFQPGAAQSEACRLRVSVQRERALEFRNAVGR